MATVTVVPTVEAGTTPPRIRLDITDTGIPERFTVNVVRNNPDGTSELVRTPKAGAVDLTTSGSNRVGTVYDYEAALGAGVTYSTLESPTVVSAEVTVSSSRVWLIHPGVPELSQPLELGNGSLAEETWTATQGIYWPLGRKYPVIHSDGQRKAPASSVTAAIDTLSDLYALQALVDDASVLLLNVPATLGLGVDRQYVAVTDVRVRRMSEIGTDPQRWVDLPFQVAERPALTGSSAARTYTDLISTFTSYAQMQSRYDTYTELLAGP